MDRTPLFPFVIEVLLDHDTGLAALPRERHDLHYTCLPDDYSTPNGTLNKARALNYALETSSLPPNAWIVHLDEETQPTAFRTAGAHNVTWLWDPNVQYAGGRRCVTGGPVPRT
jgi:hypothetical protein